MSTTTLIIIALCITILYAAVGTGLTALEMVLAGEGWNWSTFFGWPVILWKMFFHMD